MDKETRVQLRNRFKKAVHQKHPTTAFRLAMMASNTMRSTGMEPEQALEEAGRWLCAHGKGPSLSEWKELAHTHRMLVASSNLEDAGQMELFQFTHLLVLGLSNWKRHLRRLPQIIDVVVGATIPILTQTEEVPVSMRLMLIEKVEEVLGHHNKTPAGRCSLAELKMTRGRLLVSLEDEENLTEGRLLLKQQLQVFSRLAKQGTPNATKLMADTKNFLKEL